MSFLSIFMQAQRNRDIEMRYQDLRGEWREIRAGEERYLSELLQHEIDQLDAPTLNGEIVLTTELVGSAPRQRSRQSRLTASSRR